MRQARAEDYQRGVLARSFPLTLRSVKFEDVPSLGSGELEFDGGMNVLCGGNGVGKSSILHGIFATLSEDIERLPPKSLRRLQGGTFHCVFDHAEHGAVEKQVTFDIAGGITHEGSDQEIGVVLLDPGLQAREWLRKLGGMENVEELLEPLEPQVSSNDELKEISYLCHKDYSKRLLYEVEDLDPPSPALPYMVVTSGGNDYQFEDMGLGELALQIFYWEITRIESETLVLLEEPETFVSPRSQRSLMDLLYKYILYNDLCAIATTHSLGVAGRVPIERITLLHSSTPNVGVVKAPRPYDLNSVLGVPQERRVLLLVEDRTARLMTKNILDDLDRDLTFLCDIQDVGGAADITAALSSLPKNTLLRLGGIYDAGYEVDGDGFEWPYTNLPGESSPEEELKATIEGAEGDLAALLGLGEGEVQTALAGVQGLDEHDWLIELGRALHRTIDHLVFAMSTLWLKDPDNRTAGEEFVEKLHEMVKANVN